PCTKNKEQRAKNKSRSAQHLFSVLWSLFLIDSLRLPAPLFLSQDELLHLAGRGLGQLAELDRGRAFVARDLLAAELDDLRLGGAVAGLERHESLGPLAPGLVGDGDHGALQHGRVLRDRLLDLDRRNILAARDDDILLAVAQLDIAVGVPDAQVAGVEP